MKYAVLSKLAGLHSDNIEHVPISQTCAVSLASLIQATTRLPVMSLFVGKRLSGVMRDCVSFR